MRRLLATASQEDFEELTSKVSSTGSLRSRKRIVIDYEKKGENQQQQKTVQNQKREKK